MSAYKASMVREFRVKDSACNFFRANETFYSEKGFSFVPVFKRFKGLGKIPPFKLYLFS